MAAYWLNRYFPNDDLLRINEYYFSTRTTEEKYKTLMHELGHALGIDEMNPVTTIYTDGNENIVDFESYSNVMVQGTRSLTELGPCDKSVYRYLWE